MSTTQTKQKKIEMRFILIGILAVLIILGAGIFFLFGKMAPSAGTTRVMTIDKMTQAYVPAGLFLMGDKKENGVAECKRYNKECEPFSFSNAEPPSMVNVSAFWMDITEVSNGQYKLCVDAGKCKPPSSTRTYSIDSYYGNPEYDNYPVVFVNWNDAVSYCQWAGRRLPTEAEWEKAARGTDGRQYPWGNEPVTGKRANFADKNFPFKYSYAQEDDGFKSFSPVGHYPLGASPYGILDMAGNVHEWTASLYKPYPYQANDGREDLKTEGERSTRGNAVDANIYQLLAATRSSLPPTKTYDYLGFRCVSSN